MEADREPHQAEELKKRTQKYLRFKLEPGDIEHLDNLSEEQRKALLSEGSYQERAAQLNIPVGTVRSRLHRARAALDSLRQRAAGNSGHNPN